MQAVWIVITYPERLLAQEIRMTRPGPKSLCDETTFEVRGGPTPVGEGPVIRYLHSCVLVCLERILLIVGRKLHGEIDYSQHRQDII